MQRAEVTCTCQPGSLWQGRALKPAQVTEPVVITCLFCKGPLQVAWASVPPSGKRLVIHKGSFGIKNKLLRKVELGQVDMASHKASQT